MTINDITARLLEEFGRISTSNAPDPDDGGGNFLSTVPSANLLNYYVSMDKVPGFPCIMVVPFNQSYEGKFTNMKGIQIQAEFDIHGMVQGATGTTGGQINAAIACQNLITDCIRVAWSLFISDLNASTRFQIVPGPIKTAPFRMDENHYRFYFPLTFQTAYLDYP